MRALSQFETDVARCGKRGGAEPLGDVLPVGSQNVGKSIEAGALRKAVRVRAGLEQIGLLLLGTEACFLGGCVEDAGHRTVSAVAVPGAWADCGVATEVIEDRAAQGALRVLVQGRECGGGVAGPFG